MLINFIVQQNSVHNKLSNIIGTVILFVFFFYLYIALIKTVGQSLCRSHSHKSSNNNSVDVAKRSAQLNIHQKK